MTPLLEGILAGYGIAIPVGAIVVLIVSAGMRCGFRTGFMAGAGAATADLLYALLASVAGVAISRALAPVAFELRVLGGVLLIFLAIFGLWQGRREQSTQEGASRPCRQVPAYFQFLGLTIINPLTVIYFTALVLGRGPAALQYHDQRPTRVRDRRRARLSLVADHACGARIRCAYATIARFPAWRRRVRQPCRC